MRIEIIYQSNLSIITLSSQPLNYYCISMLVHFPSHRHWIGLWILSRFENMDYGGVLQSLPKWINLIVSMAHCIQIIFSWWQHKNSIRANKMILMDTTRRAVRAAIHKYALWSDQPVHMKGTLMGALFSLSRLFRRVLVHASTHIRPNVPIDSDQTLFHFHFIAWMTIMLI